MDYHMEPPFELDPQTAQTYNHHQLHFETKSDNLQKKCLCVCRPSNNLDFVECRNHDYNIFQGKIERQLKEALVQISLDIVPSDLEDHDKHT